MERALAFVAFAALVGAAYGVFTYLRHKKARRDLSRDA